ncbi:MAG TPA: DUF748 domain-containing protein, partial [Bdellovibrio sp.]|nr:DUF748 domain-containing protein [Bdellovibrio sp.]
IHNLRLEQEKSDEPVLTWQNMDLQGVKVQYKPLSIHVDDVLIEKPNTQIILNSDGTLNFKTLMRPTNGQQNPESKNTPSVEEKSGSPENKSMDMVVSKVRIKQGELDYSDLQIRPHFSAHVHNLDGVIGPIAYGTSEKINVELTGNVEAYGTFKGHGFVILREKWPDLNLDMNFHNIELTTFTPYSGRFAGYEISKGKLFLDINYTLVNQRIKGKNHILLDQLTLGKKIESEKATHLPVKFALALMKDRKGQIDFKLPVEGDLGSPSFSWSNLIWTAVENLFVKIITSPFDFIAGLFGGGAELQTIYFSPGASTLAVEEQSKVQSVAKALTERPDLALEIKGEYQEQDIDEFRKTKLNSRLESLLKSHKNDRSAALHSLAKSTLKADELKALEKSPDDDIEKKLLSTMPVTNEELKSLGIARGQAVFSSLTASQIDAQRIYLLSSGKSEDNKNPHASLNLKEK